jgi:hypothetical protein
MIFLFMNKSAGFGFYFIFLQNVGRRFEVAEYVGKLLTLHISRKRHFQCENFEKRKYGAQKIACSLMFFTFSNFFEIFTQINTGQQFIKTIQE